MTDIFYTPNLLMAVEQLTPPTSFLKDRYFPTNDATDIFSTDDVLVEYKEGKKRLAPFVAPRKGGVTITRDGFYAERFTPPFIAPRRTLTIDDLKKKGFGESLLVNLTPEQRQATMILKDASELDDMTTRREETMAAETLMNNKCVMKHIADDAMEGDELEIKFYDGDNNPATYTPSVKWGESGCDILGDMAAMIRMLTTRGLPATDMLVAPDVADIILADEKIQKLLDNRNYNIGGVDPAILPSGVAKIARLNVKGRMIDVLCYDESYTADDGTDTPYITQGHAIITAPAVGRTLYGAVTQLEQRDGEFHTYTGRRVPKYVSDATGNTRTLTLSSSPVMIPNNKNAWITSKVTA